MCTDPDGLPKLAEKQKKYLDRWVRPDDICEDPKMVYLISSFTVKQVRVCTYTGICTLSQCQLPGDSATYFVYTCYRGH